jgi:hypothetical protein
MAPLSARGLVTMRIQKTKKAVEILLTEKFDAVIVDCDDSQGLFKFLKA